MGTPPEDLSQPSHPSVTSSHFTSEKAAFAAVARLGRQRRGRPRKNVPAGERLPTYKDMGLTRKKAMYFVQLSEIPKADFEAILAEKAWPSARSMVRRYRQMCGWEEPRRSIDRLIDDVRRSVPHYSPEDVQRLLDVVADLVEAAP